MSGHEVLVKRDDGRGGYYARCVEFGCHWRAEAVGKHAAEARAQGHRQATA